MYLYYLSLLCISIYLYYVSLFTFIMYLYLSLLCIFIYVYYVSLSILIMYPYSSILFFQFFNRFLPSQLPFPFHLFLPLLAAQTFGIDYILFSYTIFTLPFLSFSCIIFDFPLFYCFRILLLLFSFFSLAGFHFIISLRRCSWLPFHLPRSLLFFLIITLHFTDYFTACSVFTFMHSLFLFTNAQRYSSLIFHHSSLTALFLLYFPSLCLHLFIYLSIYSSTFRVYSSLFIYQFINQFWLLLFTIYLSIY